MPSKRLVIGASLLALFVCAVVLTGLSFGVSTPTVWDGVELRHLLWPAFSMMLLGWRTTPLGISVTMLAVLLNCMTYVLIAWALQLLWIAFTERRRRGTA